MTILLVRTAPLPGGPRAPGYPAARTALLRAALDAVGLPLGDATGVLLRRCPTCGATDHGKPEVPAALAVGWHVSVAHTDTRLAVAVASTPCGVDVEDVDAVARAPVTAVLLGPGEAALPGATTPEGLARTWVRKEALLKATGHGLAVDPRQLVLDAPGRPPRVRRWGRPGVVEPAEWSEEVLGQGTASAVLTAVALRAP